MFYHSTSTDHHPACKFTNQNIALTINRDSHMIANQRAAFFNVFSHESYHLLSHQEVSILNQAYRHITNAIVAKIHNIQLIVDFIVSRRAESVFH